MGTKTTLSTQDKTLISIMAITVILIIIALTYACIHTSKEDSRKNHLASINGIGKSGIFFTAEKFKHPNSKTRHFFTLQEKHLIIRDPTADLARIKVQLPEYTTTIGNETTFIPIINQQNKEPKYTTTTDHLDYKHQNPMEEEEEEQKYQHYLLENQSQLRITPIKRDRYQLRPSPFQYRFKTKQEIQDKLDLILSQNHYQYQTQLWDISYLWFKDVDRITPRFSIVIPVFNQEELIQKNLNAIFKYTRDSFELIVIIDGCTDQTKKRVLDFMHLLEMKYDDENTNENNNENNNKEENTNNDNNNENKNLAIKKHVHFLDLDQITRGDCCSIIIIDTIQSVFETQCDNIGFKLASAPNIIEIQADMTMEQDGYNLVLEKPLLYYNDFIGISGRSSHGKDSVNMVGYDKILSGQNNWTNNDFCYSMPTINRGPLLLDNKKLQQLDYLNEITFTIEDDEHDLIYRAWKHYGYRAGYIFIQFESKLEDGTSRKQMSKEQKAILKARRLNKNYKIHKYAELIIPFYRTLVEDDIKVLPIEEYMFGPLIENTCVIQFGNSDTIHFHNANFGNLANLNYEMHFEKYRLYTEKHVDEFLQTLPQDIHDSPKRGYYYWAWKPWIILDTMKKQPLNSIIIYADSGMFFINREEVLEFIHQTNQNNYVFFDLWHSNRKYCKPECYHLFHEQYKLEQVMIDASLIFLKNTIEMQSFIQEWIDLCKTPYLLSDQMNPTFQIPSNFKKDQYMEHRHDQLLLSALFYNHNFRSSGIVPQMSRTFTLHHRFRDKANFSTFWLNAGLSRDMLRAF